MVNRSASVVSLPKSIPRIKAFHAVALWAAKLGDSRLVSPDFFPTTWLVSDGDDGSVLLVPTHDAPEPGFAITTTAAGQHIVLVCDPEDMDELGPFETLEEALAGISYWLALPARMIEWLPSPSN